MLFRTQYGEAITRVLGRYGAGEAAVVALETVILTAQARVKQDSTEELAKKTCRGLHMDKPGKGVVCAKCFDAAFEKGARQKVPGGDEIAARSELPPKGLAVPADTVDRGAIERDVQGMLEEPEKK